MNVQQLEPAVSVSAKPSTPALLRVEGVSVQFGALAAISDINLGMSTGEVLGLIGPNGAGKTTLVNCISGFLNPTKGSISLNDKPVGKWSPEQARKLGVARTFQGGRLFGALTVLENVEVAGLGLGMSRSQARTQAQELLGWVGFRGDLNGKAVDIPYVDERRVGMARALIGKPDFLLLDEPAAGMSDDECAHLGRLIQEIASSMSCGVLLIEHNMGLIKEVCDWTLVMSSGCELAVGPPEQTLSDKKVISAYLGEEE
ncbi:ABC transporter ATP-binding protein [Eoetvoesiella caeni]|uniref:Amino acid/amide ABC transporter ATP-binding protein 1 (HAAT family) n=1 Tax=Eoetvoesiella caeni TaxID=645616 RepID=A0A366H1R5_9BURK|nr:ABC transporter ATP-binding protein [Eoetvoesiella caeni]MCI2810990.1 ABC transporter ATP-binding protein [Eoetvoesiella caeni]NYT56888.1 ABC transporter ATP-binding protein [Eoetvoesiella caeni]RBP35456.1 amino acid/amide ABC transporter ATP-binding protein 1 (HAAT family) [Eoetvoesiella caeni]